MNRKRDATLLSKSYIKAGLGVFAAIALIGGMQGAVIDFEDLGVPVGGQIVTPINGSQDSGNFRFISLGADLHFHNQDGIGDDGSTHLGAHAFVDFSPVSGALFSLISFDFIYYIDNRLTVTVIGTTETNDITQTFTTDRAATFGAMTPYQTFTLDTRFTNLTAVRIFSPGVANSESVPGFFVDNIDAFAIIPEPASIVLLASGLTGIGLVIRRRRYHSLLYDPQSQRKDRP